MHLIYGRKPAHCRRQWSTLRMNGLFVLYLGWVHVGVSHA